MFHTINRLTACALLLGAAYTTAFAQGSPGVTIGNNTIHYDVQTGGRYTTVEERVAMRIETPQAA